MAVSRRKNGTWLCSIGSGAARQRKVFKTENEAKAYEMLSLAVKTSVPFPVSQGLTIKKEREVTLGELLRRTVSLKWRKDSGVQAENARRCLDFLGEKTPVSSINNKKLNDLVEWLYQTGNNGSTINRKLSALSMMLKVAEQDELIEHSFRMPRQKEGTNRKRVISPAEEQKIYSICDKLGMAGLKDYIQFTLDTGFRKNESLMIQEADCMAGVACLHDGETKSGKGRQVPLTSRAKEIVSRRAGHGRIFFDLNEYSLRRCWDTLRDAMGLADDAQFVIHALRHTCATRLGLAGKSALFIKEWMGHSSVVVSQQYVHLGVDSLLGGVEALEGFN